MIPAPRGFCVDVDGVRTPGGRRVTPTQKRVPALLPASQSLSQRLRVAPRQPAPQPLWAQAQVNVQGEQTSVEEALTQSQKEGECPEEPGSVGSAQVLLRTPAPECPWGVWTGPSAVCLLPLRGWSVLGLNGVSSQVRPESGTRTSLWMTARPPAI